MNEKHIASERFVTPRPVGLNRKWAAQFAKIALDFESEIIVIWSDKMLNGKSLTTLLPLCVQGGIAITVVAKGHDACEALQAIEPVFNRTFNEAQNVLQQETATPDQHVLAVVD